ncbi:MFS transporter [Aquibacillus sediminis]|uniref:MFS transporter n=1 Tax=Aquibacillus sediminis TaxID=2574734 RepID=UPI00110821B9|nr:glycoside-pentoside-hexuronide (GPH):cation symporter [Aquibacillus sediminis]
MEQRKFGVRDQFGYMLGDVGGSFVNLYIGSFFLVFATYVLGVSPYFMGTLFLVSRIFDAFTDVAMGSIPDRWKLGKSGDKFLPYINVSKWLLAGSVLLAFADVSSWGSTATHVWVVVVYLFYGIAYTADSIPYGSLAAVITQDPIERTKLSRARAIGGMIVGIGAMSIVPMFIYDNTGAVVPDAFFIVATIFAIGSLLAYTGLVRLTTERVRDDQQPGEKSDYKFKDALIATFKNRQLIGMMVASVGSLIMINGVTQLASIVFAEYYNNPGAFAINSFVQIGVSLALFLFVPKLVAKFGKRNIVIVTSSFSIIGSALLTIFIVENVYVYIALYNIATIANMTFVMIVWALVTDCLDYTELQTGKRYDGTLYSIYSFSRKVGMGIGSALGSYALGWVGFQSGVESQSKEVATGVLRMYNGLPIVAFALMLIGLLFIFNLNNDRTNEMYQVLESKRTA